MALKIITKVLVMDAIYWGGPENDGRGGFTTDAPIDLKVRWDDMVEQFLDTEGRERISNAQVMVGQDLVTGGFLKQGTVASLGTNKDHNSNELVFEIRKFDKIPTIKGDQFFRQAFL